MTGKNATGRLGDRRHFAPLAADPRGQAAVRLLQDRDARQKYVEAVTVVSIRSLDLLLLFLLMFIADGYRVATALISDGGHLSTLS